MLLTRAGHPCHALVEPDKDYFAHRVKAKINSLPGILFLNHVTGGCGIEQIRAGYLNRKLTGVGCGRRIDDARSAQAENDDGDGQFAKDQSTCAQDV